MTTVTGQPGVDRGDENRAAGRRDWDARLARRTHALGGSEITAILSLAGATDVITFSGGFPEPATFQTPVLADIAARLIADEPGVALQYAATEGLASVRTYVAGRLAPARGRAPGAGRADDHQRRHRLHGTAGQELHRPGRRGRGRGADLPRRADGVPRLRG